MAEGRGCCPTASAGHSTCRHTSRLRPTRGHGSLGVWSRREMGSPPDGPDRRDADRGRLSDVEAADGCLEELLDQLGGHGRREAAGGPQSSAEEERGRRCSGPEPQPKAEVDNGVRVRTWDKMHPEAAGKLTSQVEIGQNHTGQEAVHVKRDATVLHVLGDDGLHRAQSQHAGLVDLPPITLTRSSFTSLYFFKPLQRFVFTGFGKVHATRPSVGR